MSNLVERLRDRSDHTLAGWAREVMDEVATALEAMEREMAELREYNTKLLRFLKCSRDEGGEALARAETAERGRGEARAAPWNTFAKMPDAGRKFIALYNDGSGGTMFFAFDGGVIDSDGEEYYDWNPDYTSYDRWAYLPDTLEFWCEIRSEDPVCLRAARAITGED